MKNTKMKKVLSLFAVCVLILAFGMFAIGSGSDEENTTVTQAVGNVDSGNSDIDSVTQAEGTVDTESTDNSTLGDYKVDIKSCRLAEDYEGKPVVIVTYGFTNANNNEASAFYLAIEDNVYQNGIGLNESYVVDDSYNYNSDNSTKAIKKGASLDVEVAYELNDTTTPIEVEVKEYFSWDDKIISKQFDLK